MAWGQPKRNSKKTCCGSRGQCSCQRRVNAEIARRSDALTHCTQMCGWQRNKPCGRTARNGVCPCPNC